MDNKSILEEIRSSPHERKTAIRKLLADEMFVKKLTRYVLKNNGTNDEAKMVFHDTVVAFVKYVFKNKDFDLQSSVQSYLMGMAKNIWITELRKKSRQPAFYDIPDYLEEKDEEPIISDLILKNEKAQLITQVLSKLKIRCKEVLMYWANGYKMKEIASFLDYKSEGMARKKKSECMKEFYKFLSDNTHIKNQLSTY